MTQIASAADAPVLVAAARAGMLGACHVGVMAVTATPLRAEIVVAGASAGTPWEATQLVATHQTVLAGDTMFEVGAITPPQNGDAGSVLFVPAGASPWPDAVMLTEGGRLRVDGPDVDTATDMQATAWHATSVDAQTWPARSLPAFADPTLIKPLHLAPGEQVTLGRVQASVLAVQTATPADPARVLLRLVPNGK